MDCHISTLPKIWTNLRTQIHAWLPQPRSQLKDSIQSSLDLPKLQQVSNGNKNCTDRQNGGKKCVRPALNNLKLLLHPPASATNLSQANTVSKSIRLCPRRSCQVRLSPCMRTCSIAAHSSSPAHLTAYQLTEINLLLKGDN